MSEHIVTAVVRISEGHIVPSDETEQDIEIKQLRALLWRWVNESLSSPPYCLPGTLQCERCFMLGDQEWIPHEDNCIVNDTLKELGVENGEAD